MAEINMEPTEEAPAKSGRKKALIMGGVFLGVMLLEGGLVFFLARTFGGGPHGAEAMGGGLDAGEGQAAVDLVEVEVVEFRAQNDKAQRAVVYELKVFATVSADDARGFTELVGNKQATVQDRFSGVIRAADPERFREPDLATLREKFKKVLTEMAGEDFDVHEVLIPSIVPYTS